MNFSMGYLMNQVIVYGKFILLLIQLLPPIGMLFNVHPGSLIIHLSCLVF